MPHLPLASSLPCPSSPLPFLKGSGLFLDPLTQDSLAQGAPPSCGARERTTEARPGREDLSGWVGCVGPMSQKSKEGKGNPVPWGLSSPYGWATPSACRDSQMTQAWANAFSLLRNRT